MTGVGEDFFGDTLKLLLSFVAAPAVEIQDEEYSLLIETSANPPLNLGS